jgi:hypothetical protein
MEPLTALSSLTVRRARSLELADRPGLRVRIFAVRLAADGVRHKLYGTRAWCGTSGGAGEPQHESYSSLNPRQTKTRTLAGPRTACLGRRPTDLCATALFSFQGTDASARPFSDRITDRTGGARRQSQRGIDYHCVSIMSTCCCSVCPRVCPQQPSIRGRRTDLPRAASSSYRAFPIRRRTLPKGPSMALRRGTITARIAGKLRRPLGRAAAPLSPSRRQGRRPRGPRSCARSTCPG